EGAAAFERQIGGVDEVFMKGEEFRVHVVDAIMVAAIDDKHKVRQSIETPAIVDTRKAVEIGAGGEPRERLDLRRLWLGRRLRLGMRRSPLARRLASDR